MYQKNNQDLLSYWNNVRGKRTAPKRVEITPSAISHILPVTFILEIKNQDQLHFRLAGSKMCEIFGREFRGINFNECWPQSERHILKKYLDQLINEGTVVSTIFEATSENDHKGEFELLFLPMIHAGPKIDRILGSISPVGDFPWLGLTKLEFKEIKEVHISLLRGTSLHSQNYNNVTQLPFLQHKRLVEGKNCSLRVFDGGKTD